MREVHALDQFWLVMGTSKLIDDHPGCSSLKLGIWRRNRLRFSLLIDHGAQEFLLEEVRYDDFSTTKVPRKLTVFPAYRSLLTRRLTTS